MATYAVSGLLLAGAGYLFAIGVLSATGQTIAWMVIFFFASAAASSAYLTVSEIFPLEVRALAIAFFYAIGTGIGGVAAPWIFGLLIDTGSRWSVFGGYLIGAVLMLAAAAVAARWGVAAERKPLEAVCRPLGGRRLTHASLRRGRNDRPSTSGTYGACAIPATQPIAERMAGRAVSAADRRADIPVGNSPAPIGLQER